MFLTFKLSLLAAVILLLTSADASTCAPADLTGTQFVHPTLEYDFHMRVETNPTIGIGSGTWGDRNSETICHAKPGGQDANVAPLNTTIANGTWLDSTYLLTTNDAAPAHLLVRSSGWQAGSLWRAYIKIETGDERYFFLNTRMWIGALTAWNGTTGASYIEYDAYHVL